MPGFRERFVSRFQEGFVNRVKKLAIAPSEQLVHPEMPANIDYKQDVREIPSYHEYVATWFGALSVAAVVFGMLAALGYAVFGEISSIVVTLTMIPFALATAVASGLARKGRPTSGLKIVWAVCIVVFIATAIGRPDIVSGLTMAPLALVVLSVALAWGRYFDLIAICTLISIVVVNVICEWLLLAEALPARGTGYELYNSVYRVAAVTVCSGFAIGGLKLLSSIIGRYRYDTSYDPLTQLRNKDSLVEFLNTLGSTREVYESRYVLVLMDLNDFKAVNDVLGQQVGDQLLYAVGRTLRQHVYGADMIFRISGNTFGIVLDNTVHDDDAEVIAERLQSVIEHERGFAINGKSYRLKSRFAILYNLFDVQNGAALEAVVYGALRKAKDEGHSVLELDDDLLKELSDQRERGIALIEGSKDKESLSVKYKPVGALVGGKIHGFETQLVWDLTDGEMVFVNEYQDYIDESGLATDFFLRELDLSCQKLYEWRLLHGYGKELSAVVRVSAAAITHKNIAKSVGEIIKSHDLPGKNVVLMIKEEEVAQHGFIVYETLATLRRLYRIRIGLDGFGASLGSLQLIWDLAPDFVQIAPSLIAESAESSNGENGGRVSAIIRAAQAENASTIATGVYSGTQLEMLKTEGCDLASGPLLAGALDANMADLYLDQEIGWECD